MRRQQEVDIPQALSRATQMADQWQVFRRRVKMLKLGQENFNKWLDNCNRNKPSDATPGQYWKELLSLLPEGPAQHMTQSWRNSTSPTDTGKLRDVLKELKETYGESTDHNTALTDIINFTERDGDSLVQTIARFEFALDVYKRACEESEVVPNGRDSLAIKMAFLRATDYADSALFQRIEDLDLAGLYREVRKMDTHHQTLHAKRDRMNANKFSKQAKSVAFAERELPEYQAAPSTEERVEQACERAFARMSGKMTEDKTETMISQIAERVMDKVEKTIDKMISKATKPPPKRMKGAATMKPVAAVTRPEPTVTAGSGPPCVNFNRGQCANGSTCYYLHGDGSSQQ